MEKAIRAAFQEARRLASIEFETLLTARILTAARDAERALKEQTSLALLGARSDIKAQLAGLGLGVGMILSPEFRQFGDLAQQGMGLLFLKYSRDDERQADELGYRYMVNGGWDAREMPEVFGVLKRVSEVAGAGRLPNWLATHPDPVERQEQERVDDQRDEQAEQSSARGVPPRAPPRTPRGG